MNLTPPRIILLLCTVLSAAGLLTGLGGLGLGVRELATGNNVAQTWFFVGSQVLMTVSAAFGVLTGLNRFGSGPALAMLISAGGAVTAGVLGEPILVGRFLGIGGSPTNMLGIRTTHLGLLEIGIGAALTALAALTVLARRPRDSVRYLLLAAVLLVPIGAMLAAAMLPSVRGVLRGLHPVLATVGAMAAFLVFGALFASGVHCLIRAFEIGCPPLPGPPKSKSTGAAPSKKAAGASKPKRAAGGAREAEKAAVPVATDGGRA